MQINHVQVRATNLDRMTRFWTELIGLERGYRPPFNSSGAWFYSNGRPIIHVMAVGDIMGDGPFDHVAIEGADYRQLIARLQQHNADYRETSVPGSGDRQVFIAGPDGLKVEMLFPQGD
ncbi:VOC family protein [Microbulbifer litoralis]|uniref:VOC family protein n=1 Tax=Microbulbifer litoralis TaxID=2933965 RepID=UPI002027CAD9|nr:VOC family protein [Microbulbifer sp. GX H0434]